MLLIILNLEQFYSLPHQDRFVVWVTTILEKKNCKIFLNCKKYTSFLCMRQIINNVITEMRELL